MAKKKEPPDKGNFIKNKPSYSTVKTSLKSIIKNVDINNKINDLVVKCNNIVIDAYMFIRLFALYHWKNNHTIKKLDEDFIYYSIMAIRKRDARGKEAKNTNLLEELNNFYTNEFQPIFNHKKHDLKGLTFTLPYI